MNPVRATEDRLTLSGIIWIPIALIIMDRAITLAYWSYESNPAVLALGKLGWIGLTASYIFALAAVWYGFEMYRSRIGIGLVGVLTGVYLFALGGNLFVLL